MISKNIRIVTSSALFFLLGSALVGCGDQQEEKAPASQEAASTSPEDGAKSEEAAKASPEENKVQDAEKKPVGAEPPLPPEGSTNDSSTTSNEPVKAEGAEPPLPPEGSTNESSSTSNEPVKHEGAEPPLPPENVTGAEPPLPPENSNEHSGTDETGGSYNSNIPSDSRNPGE